MEKFREKNLKRFERLLQSQDWIQSFGGKKAEHQQNTQSFSSDQNILRWKWFIFVHMTFSNQNSWYQAFKTQPNPLKNQPSQSTPLIKKIGWCILSVVMGDDNDLEYQVSGGIVWYCVHMSHVKIPVQYILISSGWYCAHNITHLATNLPSWHQVPKPVWPHNSIIE